MNGNEEKNDDASSQKCGATAFANAFIETDTSNVKGATSDDGRFKPGTSRRTDPIPRIELGWRRCSLDTRAADALAALVHDAKTNMNMEIKIDASMNYVLEDEMEKALHGDSELGDYLNEMAERHLEAMEILRLARQRAIEASKAAAARARAESQLEASWGTPLEMGDQDDENNVEQWQDDWDSDQDYEEEGDPYEGDDSF